MRFGLKTITFLFVVSLLPGGSYPVRGENQPHPRPSDRFGTANPEIDGGRVVGSDESGMILEIEVPEYELGSYEVNGESYQRLSIPGYLPWVRAGRPTLPAKTMIIPLPGVESVEIAVSSSKTVESHPLRLYVPPFREWTAREVEAGLAAEKLADPRRVEKMDPAWRRFLEWKKKTRFVAGEKGKLFQGKKIFPEKVVEAGVPYWRGEKQFVNLLVNPLQYYPPGGELTRHSRITVKIKYGSGRRARPERGFSDYGVQFALAQSADSFKAEVADSGICAITYQNLVDAGAGAILSGDPEFLHVYFRGDEIPVFISGQGDGGWDPGDYLHFYGEANAGMYTQTNVYWLYQTQAGPGLRMMQLSSPPGGRPVRQQNYLAGIRLEENHLYSELPAMKNDHWFWALVFPALQFETDFQIFSRSDLAGNVPFIGRFMGLTSIEGVDPDHHTRVYFNDQTVGDFFWDGQEEYILQTIVPQSCLREGLNTIRVNEIADTGAPYDYAYVNNFDLNYLRGFACQTDRLRFSASSKGDYTISGFSSETISLYDITDPLYPEKVVDASAEAGGSYSLRFRKFEADEKEYVVQIESGAVSPVLEKNQPSDLVSSRWVDYIAITHPDFGAAVQPLLDLRSLDFRVEKFEVQEVYDSFSYGNFDPAGIRNFLEYAFSNWSASSRPGYVLLVGDGTFDFLNYSGMGVPNYLPPYLFESAYMQTASDNRYVCVAGDDNVPDMNIGRLSVGSFAEASELAQKIIAYQNQTSGLPWQEKVLMVADDPDTGGNFPADSDWLIANYIPAPYVADKAYIPDLGVAGTHTAILDGINDGRLLVNYMGHGTTSGWASPSIFGNSDIGSLTNPDRLPLVTTLTCMNGYWINLYNACLAEYFTRPLAQGFIAAWSPSGYALNNVSKILAASLFQELLVSGKKELGPAITAAKAACAGTDEVDLYTLFGDPALMLK